MDYESRIIFAGNVIQIGEWRCSPDSSLWGEENVISGQMPTIVFPRSTVQIQQTGRELFVTSPNQVVFYNKAQTYRRSLASSRGDICEYVYVDANVVAEIQSSLGLRRCDDIYAPFTKSQGPCSTRVFLIQRSICNSLLNECVDPLLIEETFLSILPSLLFDAEQGFRPGKSVKSSTIQSRLLHTELVKEYIVKNASHKVVLKDVADFCGSSIYHTCRIFKEHTGLSIFQFLMSLRLRKAFECVLDSQLPLTQIAVESGFSSHSHLSNLFKREFGFSPAYLRKRRPFEIIKSVLKRN